MIQSTKCVEAFVVMELIKCEATSSCCWHPEKILSTWSAAFTGTVFYFAAESENELLLWMDSITQATFKQDFSKTGQESEGNLFLDIFLNGAVKSEHHCQQFINQKLFMCLYVQSMAKFPKWDLVAS